MRVLPQTVLALALLAVPAYAAEAPATAPEAQSPAGSASPGQPAGTGTPAGSAQIAFVSGTAAIYQLGQSDWTRAAADLPIASGAWLATDPKSRAEIRRGADALDLANGTEVNFADLHGQRLQVAMQYGRIEVRLHQPTQSQSTQGQSAQGRSDEIDLPGGAVWLTAPGTYDISVGAAGQPSRIAVFDGSAHFAGGGVDQTIPSGNALVLRQAGANLTGSVARATPDEFARWARARNNDRRQEMARAEPAPTAAPATGTSEPNSAAESQNAAAPDTAVEPRAPSEHRARGERHRHLERHRYVRVFRHRHYRYAGHYGYVAAAPALPSPFGVIHSLLSIIP